MSCQPRACSENTWFSNGRLVGQFSVFLQACRLAAREVFRTAASITVDIGKSSSCAIFRQHTPSERSCTASSRLKVRLRGPPGVIHRVRHRNPPLRAGKVPCAEVIEASFSVPFFGGEPLFESIGRHPVPVPHPTRPARGLVGQRNPATKHYHRNWNSFALCSALAQ